MSIIMKHLARVHRGGFVWVGPQRVLKRVFDLGLSESGELGAVYHVVTEEVAYATRGYDRHRVMITRTLELDAHWS